ncbi:hypothetical protein Pmar_PMAR011480 [Perkinsus marinus ATCC 50983]|uniref:Uncharacterized protein n=1 Tax=Perkinsus marinus (strain ATCC 50983 / TXsc) TaxID=423536 RepID=C5LBX5_PERM5|nr:hypothetical protein Pmar_PMAR011480 [Perkinsus marinus ATCC 50983]EER05458.1 hypothetical protein Pmar_PMAR011480 [Perkinsus marinus ATCC 50983]|eukprot:XP_002773642.1 hypothetical protein Pmar_PMAR011480 [Perkinsus marinus ATCC 50983]
MSSRLGEDATLFVQQDTSSAPLAVTQLESSGQADAEDDTMLLYRPSSFITLPKHSSPYALAKRAENARDYKKALYWHTQCIEQGIRVVSAVMDVVELFEKFGEEEEALGLMMRYEHLVPKERYHAFRRLYDRVKRGLDRSVPTGPRMLGVTLVSPRAIEERGMEAICEAHPDTGSQVAYVQFENQTSAKKAMMTEKVLCNIQVRWAEKTVTMLPPPKHALVDARRVLDSERFITSPFDTSLMLYTVPYDWTPETAMGQPEVGSLEGIQNHQRDDMILHPT